MQNPGLDESQAGIKIARGNINNFRYVNDTTLKAESKEELKHLLKKMKQESEKAGLILNILNTSWQIDGEKMKTVTDFTFLGSKITAESDRQQP